MTPSRGENWFVNQCSCHHENEQTIVNNTFTEGSSESILYLLDFFVGLVVLVVLVIFAGLVCLLEI